MSVMKTSIARGLALVGCLLATACPFNGDDDDQAGCDLSAAAGISVTVLDAETETELCEARVTASDGSYDEELGLWLGEGCSYVGLWERGGEFDVAVTQEGYEDATDHVLIPEGRCHVEQQFLVVYLEPVE